MRIKVSKKVILIFDAVLIALITLLFVSIKTPEEIKGLKVDSSTYNSVNLSWNKSDNATTYHIYRSRNGDDYEYLGATRETTYEDGNLTTGANYEYSVRPVNGIKKADRSKAVEVTPNLETPTIRGNVKKGEVRLSILEVDGAEGYSVYRNGVKITDIPAEEKTEEQTVKTFVDEEAQPDTEYRYEVRAFRKKAQSEPSNELELKMNSVCDMTAAITLDKLTLSWDDTDYSTYKLYSGNELLTETADHSYEMDAEPGEYEFRLVGFREKTQSPDNIQKFSVTEEDMDNSEAIDAACEWAVEIANDDSFTYGTGERAHKCGCYFCGTNLSIKGKSKVNGHSYEKTYCCNPFVHASFAHGAGDETMLKACQTGHSVGMTEKSYTRYGNWDNVGKPKMKNLRKGDVLVANPNKGDSESSHVMLYLGDGQIVHAARSGWDDDSIRVNKLTSGNYGRCDFVMRYTGNGSGKMLKVTEIEEPEEIEKPAETKETAASASRAEQ